MEAEFIKYVKSLHANLQMPLFGDVNAAKFNKNTSKTLTFNNLIHPLYKSSTLFFPLVLLSIFFTKLDRLL